jgi:hypothetical protein
MQSLELLTQKAAKATIKSEERGRSREINRARREERKRVFRSRNEL